MTGRGWQCWHSVAVGTLLASSAAAAQTPRIVTASPWPAKLGSQRAIVHVSNTAAAVRVRLMWRRRDHDTAAKAVLVTPLGGGQPIQNEVRIQGDRFEAEVVFQPTAGPGDYAIYYLQHNVWLNYGGYSGGYTQPTNRADASWLVKSGLDAHGLTTGMWRDLPAATVVRFESRSAFDNDAPMEVCATPQETAAFIARNPESYFLFGEDAAHPIWMRNNVPLRWIGKRPNETLNLRGLAQNQYATYQLGVWASRGALSNIRAVCSAMRGPSGRAIPAADITCFNLGGVGPNGSRFTKRVDVPAGHIQPLWFGVSVPSRCRPGDYSGTVTIKPSNAPAQTIHVVFGITRRTLADRGDGEHSSAAFSRARWLNSRVGEREVITPPYVPLRLRGNTIECLGRSMTLGPDGIPAQIRAFGHPVLAGPLQLNLSGLGGASQSGALRFTRVTPARVEWQSRAVRGNVVILCRGWEEFDGYSHFAVTLLARQAAPLKDVQLLMPVRRAEARYFMGIGLAGGFRPSHWLWQWTGPYSSFWIGSARAGFHFRFLGASYSGPLLNLYHPAPPPAWFNGGAGGCSIGEPNPREALVDAFTGRRILKPGAPVTLKFAILPTPVKPLNTRQHFTERYFHSGGSPAPDPAAVAAGVNIINVHQGNLVNPYINYPMGATGRIRTFAHRWHAAGMKVKIYDTVRELSNHALEMPLLRSLGSEILYDGGGGGYTWLREHLRTHYQPAWYTPLPDGQIDAAVQVSGESRWYNYYVAGAAWMARSTHIDGLYLDDVAYNRSIIQRLRRALDAARPGSLIDLHSDTLFSIGPANQYTEYFPYIDRTWFGEGFDYNHMSPDQWLVQCSGIPFGLMGDMLQGGGNRWLGMVYGMTLRLPWVSGSNHADPRPIWKEWDKFGIAGARMIGYWQPQCPVRTDTPNVLATVYRRKRSVMIAIGSWAKTNVEVHLKIDWRQLGFRSSDVTLTAPAIEHFQPAATFAPDAAIPVAPLRGMLLVMSPKSAGQAR
ncbi:MAG: hypothetical protein KGJ62_03530 [Armatimonadetes bacterium]|nr:hypothetical protein [Armatimonadota bacterium]MDE2206073.1 hypothetical protein [Armatimonadota bacterium]